MSTNTGQSVSRVPDQELLERHYPDGAPIVIQVGFKYGYGPALVELNQKVYFNPDLSFSSAIREAIQGIVLSSCENRYCLVMHMRGLIAEGFTMEEVQRLIESQELPDRVPDRMKWEVTLRRLAALVHESRLAPNLYTSLWEFHPREVIDEIGGVVAFSLLHQVLLDLYADEIRIEEEPILFKTIDCADELIQYTGRIGRRELPVYSLCCLCKDVKAKSGWVPIERALDVISSRAAFSHGFCDRCAARQQELLDAE